MALKSKWLISKRKAYSCTMTGVYRAAAFCRGCVVLFHSPRGCAHVASSLDMGSQYRTLADGQLENLAAVPLVSSNLGEKDSIFGGMDRLRDAIRYTMETYRPECLIVASSCVAGVIGDDVEAAAEDAEAEYGIPVLAVATGGFLGGEYGEGYKETALQIIRRFFRPREKAPGRVLLLGDQMGPWGQYAREVRRILAGFGLSARWQFPGYVPFTEWPDIPTAAWQVPLGGLGGTNGALEELSAVLEKEFGIVRLTKTYPVGWDNTVRFIRDIGAALGRPADAEALIKETEDDLARYVEALLPVTRGKRAFLGIGRDAAWYDPADTVRSLMRLGIGLAGVILYDNLSDAAREDMKNILRPLTDAPFYTMETGQAALAGADVFLTTDEILDVRTRQLFIPMVPLVGASGEKAMLRAVYRLLCRYGERGGIAYVST